MELSVRGYAKHRGVAHRAVQVAIEAGRIETLPNGKIDPEIADKQWADNTDPNFQNHMKKHDDDGSVADGFGGTQYSRARAVREHFAARITKLEYEERTGKLVEGDAVQVAAFNRFRQFRDAMISIPDRIAAMVAAEPDEAVCHGILTQEIRKALNDFADAAVKDATSN